MSWRGWGEIPAFCPRDHLCSTYRNDISVDKSYSGLTSADEIRNRKLCCSGGWSISLSVEFNSFIYPVVSDRILPVYLRV